MFEQIEKLKGRTEEGPAVSVTQKKSLLKPVSWFVDSRPQIASIPVSSQRECKVLRDSQSPAQRVVQARMASDANELTWSSSGSFSPTPFAALPEPHVEALSLVKSNSPHGIPKMDDANISAVIKDPSRADKQRLTKMHMIRAQMGGPGTVDNLKLGTASSNNGGDGSHTKEVEYPIGRFINANKGKHGVAYTVSVGDSTVPSYLTKRVTSGDTDTESFLKDWCPSSFKCDATYYRQTHTASGWIWEKAPTQTEYIRLDQGS